jgi:thiamine kinase-like enzyme
MGPPADPVFGLGDGNLGNFLWDGERCHVVDFEDSGVSDPAYEVADLVEHVSVSLPDLVDADTVVSLLELDAEQRARLAGFRRLMAAFWLLMLLPGSPAHHRNPAGAVELQARRLLDML